MRIEIRGAKAARIDPELLTEAITTAVSGRRYWPVDMSSAEMMRKSINRAAGSNYMRENADVGAAMEAAVVRMLGGESAVGEFRKALGSGSRPPKLILNG
jgi:hypothetical protein